MEIENRVVEGVTLHWPFASIADQMNDVIQLHPDGRFGTCGVRDFFKHDRTLQIIDPEVQRQLRHPRRDHDPVCLHMLKIVQQDPADSECLEVVHPSRPRTLPAQGPARSLISSLDSTYASLCPGLR